MTQHTVDVQSQVRSGVTHTVDDGSGAAQGASVIDVSHLRPVSEGVLRRAGLHGGTDVNGDLRDKRNESGEAFDIDPAGLPSTELHVQKMKLEHKFKGIVTRDSERDGSITLSLIHGDGDITTARGATDADAYAKLFDKMGGID